MRALLWHVSALRAEVTERGRSPLVEPPEPAVIETADAVLVLAAAERDDEPDPARVDALVAALRAQGQGAERAPFGSLPDPRHPREGTSAVAGGTDVAAREPDVMPDPGLRRAIGDRERR